MSIKNMLVDATQPEETRVAVVSQNNLLQDFDFESTVIKQLKGNIYLAKVTRVEPSLQAAFLEYGGNRQGFLPFSEIHPDYFRIPIADREKLIEQEKEILDREEKEEEEALAQEDEEIEEGDVSDVDLQDQEKDEAEDEDVEASEQSEDDSSEDEESEEENDSEEGAEEDAEEDEEENTENGDISKKEVKAAVSTEHSDVVDQEIEESKPKFRVSHRQYKIQEVIKPRQIMLVQISKEERGNKGAAITTYISLPGRYCVLMPNSSHGGGVSRKVGNPAERRKMKKILEGLGVPDGMSVILRTAGLDRTKVEIKRDLDYLLRLWNSIREKTLESTAPALVYEEGNLIKRSIRDLYDNDIDEVIVSGKEGYKEAKDFMKMLMPSHAKKVKEYKDEKIPLFQHYSVEKQIDDIFSTSAHMKSGGYIVINPTEALVSIDVNSGRSTKERHIEETALQTNLEAAEEVARQLRLRDLGGLVVVDFIDMESYRHNRLVEKRLKECLEKDRARVQVGRISNFGLLELSRQRLRPSLFETNFHTCAACTGIGRVRTVESSALMVLRAIESYAIEQSKKDKKDKTEKTTQDVFVKAHADVALYILNQKRHLMASIEAAHSVRVFVNADKDLVTGSYSIVKADGTEIKSVDTNQNSQEANQHDHKHKHRHNNQQQHGRHQNNHQQQRQESQNQPRHQHNQQHPRNNPGNNPEVGEDEDDLGSKRRRRRGRRGGRRRNQRGPQDGMENSEDNENSQNQNQQHPNQRQHHHARHDNHEPRVREDGEGNRAPEQSQEFDGNRQEGSPENERGEGGNRRRKNRRRRGRDRNHDRNDSGEARSDTVIIPIEDGTSRREDSPRENSERSSAPANTAGNENPSNGDKPKTASANSGKPKGWWKRLKNKDGE